MTRWSLVPVPAAPSAPPSFSVSLFLAFSVLPPPPFSLLCSSRWCIAIVKPSPAVLASLFFPLFFLIQYLIARNCYFPYVPLAQREEERKIYGCINDNVIDSKRSFRIVAFRIRTIHLPRRSKPWKYRCENTARQRLVSRSFSKRHSVTRARTREHFSPHMAARFRATPARAIR